jgi:archaeal cell division control protein 6
MTREKAAGDPQKPTSSATEHLIHQAFLATTSKKIALQPEFLDDEKLPETERLAVLQEIFHRRIRVKQLTRLARALSPLLGNAPPPNVLVYGPSGAGKSVTCLHFLSALAGLCREKGVTFHYYYVDLTTPRTCFGVLNELAIALNPRVRRYKKGMANEHMQEQIITAMNGLSGFACVLVDEADNITANGDLLLAFLAKTLPKKVRVRLFYIFLTNRLEWEKNLDPRILAVLKKQDVIFEPYNSEDLMQILQLRVERALDPARVDQRAVRKIAAYASRETGDARKAVELLAKAVKEAEDTSGRLTEREVDAAEQCLEVDKSEELIRSLASQQKLALKACYLGFGCRRRRLSTGTAFRVYQDVCREEGTRALTQRRFSDMVSFLDVYGLVNARVISKGRYGKTRELSGSLPSQVVRRLVSAGAYG